MTSGYVSPSCPGHAARTMLNSGQRRHPCLVPDRGAKASSLPTEHDAARWLFIDALCHAETFPFVSSSLSVFILEGCWILLNAASVALNAIV